MVSQPRFPAVHLRAATGDEALVRLLREELGHVMAADCIDLVLALALSRAGLEQIPTAGERLRLFLVGSLTDALEGFVGTAPAASAIDSLHTMLAPMLAKDADDPRMLSGVRTRDAARVYDPHPEPDTTRYTATDPQRAARRGSEDVTLRVPLVPGAVVLLVTREPTAYRRLKAQLDPAFNIVNASDIFTLLDAIGQVNHKRALLVLDCRLPPIPAATMLNVAAKLPQGSRVLLWGSDDQIDEQVQGLPSVPTDWVRCGEQALAEDIGALIAGSILRCA